MRKVSVVTIVLLMLAGLASAQIPTKGNIFAGYSYAHTNFGTDNGVGLNGWNASLEGKVFPFVGIVVDGSGHYGSDGFGFVCVAPCSPENGRMLTALFGPRVSFSVGKVRPFAEALFGVSHLRVEFPSSSSTDTSFASAYGGGLDYHVFPFLAWRVEADALRTQFYSGTQNGFRVSTGIVFNF